MVPETRSSRPSQDPSQEYSSLSFRSSFSILPWGAT